VCYGLSGYAIWVYEHIRHRRAGPTPPPAAPGV